MRPNAGQYHPLYLLLPLYFTPVLFSDQSKPLLINTVFPSRFMLCSIPIKQFRKDSVSYSLSPLERI
jgi:hypothetical protein